MQFSLALYGSFPDTNGYTWKNPAALNTSKLEKIKSFFSTPPQDGREILPNDCIGGFYLDPVTATFYAFRFINGGCDSRGREGVVITNWVVCKLSEVLGKNIEELFSRMVQTNLQSPYIDLFLPCTTTAYDTQFHQATDSERNLFGEMTHSVFSLPMQSSGRAIFVQFALRSTGKNANIKFFRIPKEFSASKAKMQNEKKANAHDRKSHLDILKHTKYFKEKSIHAIKAHKIISVLIFIGCVFVLFKTCFCPGANDKTTTQQRDQVISSIDKRSYSPWRMQLKRGGKWIDGTGRNINVSEKRLSLEWGEIYFSDTFIEFNWRENVYPEYKRNGLEFYTQEKGGKVYAGRVEWKNKEYWILSEQSREQSTSLRYTFAIGNIKQVEILCKENDLEEEGRVEERSVKLKEYEHE